MGGFHGGHSSGSHGGFHGGSHHSHSSGHRSYRSSSVRVHYGPGVGIHISGNAPKKSRLSQIIGCFFGAFITILFGIIFLIALMDVAVKATITKTNISSTGFSKYEVYDFEYKYNNKTYYGYGDDDLDSNGELTINVGETYTLYVNPFIPSNYKFNSSAVIAVLLFIVLDGVGIFLIIKGALGIKKYRRLLQQVGDANKDGIINEDDIDYAEAKAKGKTDGVYEGTKTAETENAYQENKIYRHCAYCDSIVDEDAKFCPNCGASLLNKK